MFIELTSGSNKINLKQAPLQGKKLKKRNQCEQI